MDKYEIFKNIISQYKCKDIEIDELLGYAKQKKIEVGKRISRKDLVEEIFSECKEEFYHDFVSRIYIPAWEIPHIKNNELENLRNIGFLEERGIKFEERIYSSRDGKYTAFAYQATILNLKKDEFEKILHETCNYYPIRIDTQTEEEISKLINKFTVVGEITATRTYKKRENQGYYTYFSFRPFVNTDYTHYETNKYLSEIAELKKKIEEVRKNSEKQVEKERQNLLDFKHLLKDILKIEKEEFIINDILKAAAAYKNTENNTRGAGRKARFTIEQIEQMKKMKEEGKTFNQIATAFHTSRQTISKYLKCKEIN